MDRPHPGGRGEGRSEEVYRCYYVRYKQNVEYKDANENIPQAQGSLGSSGFGSSCGGSGLTRGGGPWRQGPQIQGEHEARRSSEWRN